MSGAELFLYKPAAGNIVTSRLATSREARDRDASRQLRLLGLLKANQ